MTQRVALDIADDQPATKVYELLANVCRLDPDQIFLARPNKLVQDYLAGAGHSVTVDPSKFDSSN